MARAKQLDLFDSALPMDLLPPAEPGKFNFRLLTLAREALGLSQAELAERTGCKPTRISKIEAGVAVPVSGEIQKFMAALNQGVNFFFQLGQATSADLSFFRKTQHIPYTAFRACNAQMNIRRLEIETKIGSAKLGKMELPYLPPEKNGGAKAVARILRQKLGIKCGPIQHLTSLAEDAGCVIVDHPFPSAKLDALCIRTQQRTPVIFLNIEFPKSRRRLSLAHELGHLTMHSELHDDVEEEAWEFAREFLMPAAEISKQLIGLNLNKLCQLKKEWGVSMQAILYYARKLEKITESSSRYLWMQIVKSGYRLSEPFEELIPDETPSSLENRVKIDT
jgi:Zn-dependent peptidase ImmA (M78 family)